MSTINPPSKLIISTRMKTIYSVLMFLGVCAFAIMLNNNPERAWHAYLIGFFYFVSLSLGGLFFSAIQHATKAGWSVNIRRFAEGLTGFLPFGALLGLIFLFGAPHLYSWLDPAYVAKDHILQHKAPYLNQNFFWIRMLLVFVGWLIFSKLIVGNSLKQDEQGGSELTRANVKWSVIFLLFFALSYSFFSVDTLMSLEPHWFSTIFGIYTFAGLFQSTLAFMILMIIYLMNCNVLRGFVTDDHLHDLGKLLFGFTVFWAYIAFSQYMLIWYANLPEETIFYESRSTGAWMWVSLGLLLFRFIVPFFALLPRWAKRTKTHLAAVCILVLVMQYVDIYWLVYPNFDHHHVVFGIGEIGVFLGFAGLFLMCVTRFFAKNSMIPHKDPYIDESMHHHVTY